MPVAMVVGGTLKLATMPLSETGSEATLKDISTWPSAMQIIGTQDSRAASEGMAALAGAVVALMERGSSRSAVAASRGRLRCEKI